MQLAKKNLKELWGYDSFLPLQEQAIENVLRGKDSVVVLPTGSGKSVCYQLPILGMDGMALVISPLISLMKDQVDALLEIGVPAARFDSMLSKKEQDRVLEQITNKSLKILYISPERILSGLIQEKLGNTTVSYIAIDEAHCISIWGHDFRQDYRELRGLRKTFPEAAFHAFTATATPKVRADIAHQLLMESPEYVVGSCDRPNLIYKIERQAKRVQQIASTLESHPGESGIIYCITRKAVDALSAALNDREFQTVTYHAGMPDKDRIRNQEAWLEEQVDIIVATVAFGMGIDKSNVRFVIHAGMPLSIDNYQQESGRAGRDGLEARCYLFYSARDYRTWKFILQNDDGEVDEIALSKLNAIANFCAGVACRHRAIMEYFGEKMLAASCQACDVCLGDVDIMEGAFVVSQKILSAIKRVQENFGAHYVASVLVGSNAQRIQDNGHHTQTTFGLLSDYKVGAVRNWIEQLVTQNFIEKTSDYDILKVTESGLELLRGRADMQPVLLTAARGRPKYSRAASDKWSGVNQDLFQLLRKLRSEIAKEKYMPAFIVFGDATLRDIATRVPVTASEFLDVSGVGPKKLEQYGERFIDVVKRHLEV